MSRKFHASASLLQMLIISKVSPEQEARYVSIIDAILANSDLNTISEKRIRQGLEAEIGHDLSAQKVRMLNHIWLLITSANPSFRTSLENSSMLGLTKCLLRQVLPFLVDRSPKIKWLMD
jgi:hypothetical protein